MLLLLTFIFSFFEAKFFGFRDLSETAFPDKTERTYHRAGNSYYYFDQKLDHFNTSDDRTFKQRYLSEDKYYWGSHLMFVYISGEQNMYLNALDNNFISSL